MTIDSKALLALAERCEAATGADREIDAKLAGIFSHSVESDDGDFWWGAHDSLPVRVPAFTASLDAALTLVPEGWQWVVSQQLGQPFAGCGGSPTGGWLAWHVDAATPALALCAAALRARAAMEAAT